MRHTILILLMLITFQGFGQRMSEYTASNGITYREGDVIELGITCFAGTEVLRGM